MRGQTVRFDQKGERDARLTKSLPDEAELWDEVVAIRRMSCALMCCRCVSSQSQQKVMERTTSEGRLILRQCRPTSRSPALLIPLDCSSPP
jgi:hypothetical protein